MDDESFLSKLRAFAIDPKVRRWTPVAASFVAVAIIIIGELIKFDRVYGIVLAIGVVLIADRYAQIQDKQEIEGKLSKLFDQSDDLHYVGDAEEAILDFVKCSDGADYAHNTVYRPKVGRGQKNSRTPVSRDNDHR